MSRRYSSLYKNKRLESSGFFLLPCKSLFPCKTACFLYIDLCHRDKREVGQKPAFFVDLFLGLFGRMLASLLRCSDPHVRLSTLAVLRASRLAIISPKQTMKEVKGLYEKRFY